MNDILNVRVPRDRLKTTRPTSPSHQFELGMPSIPLVFRNFLVGNNGTVQVIRRWAETHQASPTWPAGAPLVTDDVLMALELGLELGDPVIKRAHSEDAVNPLLCMDYQSKLTPKYSMPSTLMYLKAYGYKVSDMHTESSPFSGLPTNGFLVKVIHLDHFYVYVRDYNMRTEPTIGSYREVGNVQRLDLISKVDTARMWGTLFTMAADEESLNAIVIDIKQMFEDTCDSLPF